MSRVALPTGARLAVILVLAATNTACATTPFGAPVRKPGAIEAGAGYLSDTQIERLAQTVPAPSADASPEQIADRALSDRYRVYEGGDRWLLATAHAELSPDLARQHFDCALGVRFAATPTPRLTALFTALLHDADQAAELAKTRVFRPRPVWVDAGRPACVRVSEASRASASYPSAPAAVAVAYGEALALIAPENADAAREIGHQIGISRLVCAMHYPGDVAPGETLGRATVVEAARNPEFQADVEAARAELAVVRATGLTNPGCVAERAALALPLG